MIFGEIGKIANLEKCKFERIEIQKTGNLENGNLEKGKFVKREIGKNRYLEK